MRFFVWFQFLHQHQILLTMRQSSLFKYCGYRVSDEKALCSCSSANRVIYLSLSIECVICRSSLQNSVRDSWCYPISSSRSHPSWLSSFCRKSMRNQQQKVFNCWTYSLTISSLKKRGNELYTDSIVEDDYCS